MVKRIIKRFGQRLKYGVRTDSETYIKYLRKIGMNIGERTVIYDPRFTVIDETRPWAIDIGNDVKITHGVTILTHGYDWSVLKGKYGTVLGSYGGVKIGNNVFIGVNTTILKGIHIGNNVIIGAGSLVNKDIPDDCVAVGNPAKVIMPIDQYLEKRKESQLEEAVELAQSYKKSKGIWPNEDLLAEYFWLYYTGDVYSKKMNSSYMNLMKLAGNEVFSKTVLNKHKPLFENYEDFIQYCEKHQNI